MNKALLTIASIVFAGTASASNLFLDSPNDRYSGSGSSTALSTAVQPGVGDTYGGNAFERNDQLGLASTSHSIANGSGDAYASPIPNVEQNLLTW